MWAGSWNFREAAVFTSVQAPDDGSLTGRPPSSEGPRRSAAASPRPPCSGTRHLRLDTGRIWENRRCTRGTAGLHQATLELNHPPARHAAEISQPQDDESTSIEPRTAFTTKQLTGMLCW
jgi:hypothetical protein